MKYVHAAELYYYYTYIYLPCLEQNNTESV